jgi:poly(3-hydroxybutyrate) depolymerase
MMADRIRALLLGACLVAAAAGAAPFPAGDSTTEITVDERAIEVFVYKPGNYAGRALMVSLHGLGRNAAGYRDAGRGLADRFGALLIVPLFDRERFPTWRYQQGGIARRNSDGTLSVEPPGHHTGDLLQGIVDAVRADEGNRDMPYVLIGHSAGGQLLVRVAAFGRASAERIVIANPSTWVMPSLDEAYPYGFGGLPAELAGEQALQRYLAQPVTVLLGTADTGTNNLSMTAGAMRQGSTRHARGLNAFHAAQALAKRRGWPFGWRLAEVPGVGHSASRMYRSPLVAAALCDRPLQDAAAAGAHAGWPCPDAQE